MIRTATILLLGSMICAGFAQSNMGQNGQQGQLGGRPQFGRRPPPPPPKCDPNGQCKNYADGETPDFSQGPPVPPCDESGKPMCCKNYDSFPPPMDANGRPPFPPPCDPNNPGQPMRPPGPPPPMFGGQEDFGGNFGGNNNFGSQNNNRFPQQQNSNDFRPPQGRFQGNNQQQYNSYANRNTNF